LAACVLTESGNPWRSTIAMIFMPFPRFVAPISDPPPYFTTVSAVVGAITMITPLLTGPLMDLGRSVVFRS
jgi:hypothetical protein